MQINDRFSILGHLSTEIGLEDISLRSGKPFRSNRSSHIVRDCRQEED
jgi:hypothetical protein